MSSTTQTTNGNQNADSHPRDLVTVPAYQVVKPEARITYTNAEGREVIMDICFHHAGIRQLMGTLRWAGVRDIKVTIAEIPAPF